MDSTCNEKLLYLRIGMRVCRNAAFHEAYDIFIPRNFNRLVDQVVVNLAPHYAVYVFKQVLRFCALCLQNAVLREGIGIDTDNCDGNYGNADHHNKQLFFKAKIAKKVNSCFFAPF